MAGSSVDPATGRSRGPALLALAVATVAMAAETQPKTGLIELAPEAMRALLDQASKMTEAYLRSDYVAMVDFTYPPLVRELGGREAAVAKFRKMDQEMAASFGSYEIVESKAGKVLACARTPKKQLQCVLDQRQTVRIAYVGLIRSQIDLLAFSDDGGKRWTFQGEARMPRGSGNRFPS